MSKSVIHASTGYILVTDDILIHYGVPGMKWGVRHDKVSSKTLMQKKRASNYAVPESSRRSKSKAVNWLSKTAVGAGMRARHNSRQVLGGQKKQAINTPIVTRAKAHAKANQIILGAPSNSKSMDYAGIRASWRANKLINEKLANISASKLKSDPDYAEAIAIAYKLSSQVNNRSAGLAKPSVSIHVPIPRLR